MNVPKKAQPREREIQLVTEEMKSPFADIHFDFDKSSIKDADTPTLQEIAMYLKRHPPHRDPDRGELRRAGKRRVQSGVG